MAIPQQPYQPVTKHADSVYLLAELKMELALLSERNKHDQGAAAFTNGRLFCKRAIALFNELRHEKSVTGELTDLTEQAVTLLLRCSDEYIFNDTNYKVDDGLKMIEDIKRIIEDTSISPTLLQAINDELGRIQLYSFYLNK